MAEILLREGGSEDLGEHVSIPIAFRVERVLRPRPGGGPLELIEERLSEPWWKDYDAEDGGDPALWPRRFDTSTWTVISAWAGAERLGGAVLIAHTPGIDMLEGRNDLALIWDLRVAPAHRRRGVGSRLLAAAAEWARSNGCRELKVETQNINVGACRLYERHGFELRSVVVGSYPGLSDELQLLWYRSVT